MRDPSNSTAGRADPDTILNTPYGTPNLLRMIPEDRLRNKP